MGARSMTRQTLVGRKRGLGMGLSALMGDEEPGGGEEALQRVPIEFLTASPLQPRRHFDQGELEALAESIRVKGILQPLVVRQRSDDTGYEIVAGERRWRASQIAGLHELPVVVRDLGDRDVLEIALIENLQRADLSPIEEAEAFARLMQEFGHTQEALAAALGKSRSHVANTLRLLKLPAGVRAMVVDGRLTAGHARALLSVEDAQGMAEAVVARGLNVREVEALVQAGSLVGKPPPEPKAIDPDIVACEKRLAERLGLKVEFRAGRKGGSLTVHYKSADQFDQVLARLLGEGASRP